MEVFRKPGRAVFLKPVTDRFDFRSRPYDGRTLANLEDLGCVVVKVLGAESCVGLKEFLYRHLCECHSSEYNMEPELYFPDPFVGGGWFLFHMRDRLFSWQAVRITTKGQELAVRHSSRLKALLWIEKEIQRRLAPQKYDDKDISGTYPEDHPIQRTLARLTYDWEPLNAALETAR